MQDNETLKSLIKELYHYMKKQLNFDKSIKIFLAQDKNNAKDLLCKTAYYDPENITITLYITNRHPKDILRSLAHELVHHSQYCDGKMNDKNFMSDENYFQKSKYMKELEREAFERGNMVFREWEESKKYKKD